MRVPDLPVNKITVISTLSDSDVLNLDRYLHAVVIALGVRPDRIDDVCNQTWLKALDDAERRPDRWQNMSQVYLRNRLRMIARNLLADVGRSAKSEHKAFHRFVQIKLVMGQPVGSQTLDTLRAVFQKVERTRAELSEDENQLLDCLVHALQVVRCEATAQDASSCLNDAFAEYAARSGCTIKTARCRALRCLHRLRSLLDIP